jgi:hypothetical protein
MIQLRYWQLSLLAFLIAILAAYYLPTFGPESDVSMIFSVTTFLFGLIAAFNLAGRHNRYTDLRKVFAVESGTIAYMYQLAGIVGKKFQGIYREYLDDYLTTIFDYKFYDYSLTSTAFYSLFKPLKGKVETSTKVQEEAVDGIVDSLGKLSELRKEIMIHLDDRMVRMEWLTLIVLDIIIIFSLYYSKTAAFASVISVAMLATASVIILIFLWILDSLSWKFESWSVEPYQRVFEMMGKPRYYPAPQLRSGGKWKLPDNKDYRLAEYKIEAYPKIIKKVKTIKAKRK